MADVTPAIHAAMRATTTVPIVMALAADPVGNGLVSNLARPGGNVTGISLMLPDVGAKRLQLLKDTLPNVSRVAVLWNPEHPVAQTPTERARSRRFARWDSSFPAHRGGGPWRVREGFLQNSAGAR